MEGPTSERKPIIDMTAEERFREMQYIYGFDNSMQGLEVSPAEILAILEKHGYTSDLQIQTDNLTGIDDSNRDDFVASKKLWDIYLRLSTAQNDIRNGILTRLAMQGHLLAKSKYDEQVRKPNIDSLEDLAAIELSKKEKEFIESIKNLDPKVLKGIYSILFAIRNSWKLDFRKDRDFLELYNSVCELSANFCNQYEVYIIHYRRILALVGIVLTENNDLIFPKSLNDNRLLTILEGL